MAEGVRTDKWLWAVRFYKTRSLAAKECTAGKIKRNGHSLKAATTIKIGDILQIPAADNSHKRQVEVTQLLEKRVSSPLAAEAWLDHTPVDVLKEAAERRAEQKLMRQTRQEGDQGRMTKRQRRLWESKIHGFTEPE